LAGQTTIDKWVLTDLSGKVLLEQKAIVRRSSTIDMDITSLGAGIYQLKLHDGDEVIIKRIILQEK